MADEKAPTAIGFLECSIAFFASHGALGHRSPIERLRQLTGNNVAGIYV